MHKPKSRDNKDVLLINYPYLPIIPLKVETFLHLPIKWYDISLELSDDALSGQLYLLNDKTQSLKFYKKKYLAKKAK